MRFAIARFLLAAFAVALFVGSAHAQAPGGGGFGGGHKQQKSDKPAEQKPKVDDKAYKNALKSLPDKPYDPWHGAR
ncbi:MAG: hypothetical protein ABSB37_11785 [Xanthobacteraceae bacterium]|jgi:hypothetical protein